MANEMEALRKKIADKKNLPGVFAEWLRGETEKELEADADRLIKFVRPDVVLDIGEMKPAEIREHADKLLKQSGWGK